MDKRKVIIVTDGDMAAKEAVEKAASNIGARCISSSAGNPTVLSGEEIIARIKKAPHDPVVVMVDDKGAIGRGPGEAAMEKILQCSDLEVLGVIAVSSNGKDCFGLKVDCSVTRDGRVVRTAVDKHGMDRRTDKLCGDTLSILRSRDDIFTVGIGDPGKMYFSDDVMKGSPVTTQAMRIILEHNGI
ncbi:MAG: stage V sporulation protein AE [Clostridiaceae bacterium]|jgi:stage V sporulation protein AE|nr:stage V sporulation protein AE [Clostridiaceae bacterium]